MTAEDQTLVIVYQFGKVASTSLVNTLKTVDGLDVHQSHFLGESALQKIVSIAVSKETNGYFHQHLRGQLLANVELTYRMNRVLAGHGAAKLKVLSLSREPLDWLRSGVLQDIAGYRPDLLGFAENAGLSGANELESLQAALTAALAQITGMIDQKGGLAEVVTAFHLSGGKTLLAPFGAGIEAIVRKMFFLALRPHTWFDEHFRACFGIGLDGFRSVDGIWTARAPRADFVILRYEDLDASLPVAFETLGFGAVRPLLRDNVSREKPLSDVVARSFASAEAEALRSRLQLSDYARFFGYDAGGAPARAATG